MHKPNKSPAKLFAPTKLSTAYKKMEPDTSSPIIDNLRGTTSYNSGISGLSTYWAR